MFFACGILSAPQIARGKWWMRVLKKKWFFFFFFLAEEKNRTNLALGCAVVWMSVPPPLFIRWNPNVQSSCSRDGAFGRGLGHRVESSVNGVSALRGDPTEPSCSPLCGGLKRKTAIYQETGPPQIPNLLAPCSWTAGFQNGEKEISVVCKSPCVWYFGIAAERDWDRVSGVTESVCVGEGAGRHG